MGSYFLYCTCTYYPVDFSGLFLPGLFLWLVSTWFSLGYYCSAVYALASTPLQKESTWNECNFQKICPPTFSTSSYKTWITFWRCTTILLSTFVKTFPDMWKTYLLFLRFFSRNDWMDWTSLPRYRKIPSFAYVNFLDVANSGTHGACDEFLFFNFR